MSQLSRIKFLSTVGCIAVISLFGQKASAQANSDANSYPNPYRQVEGWAKDLPGGRQWGSTNALYVDPKGNIWVAERCGANSCADSTLDPILEFDTSGKLIKSFGGGLFVVPHGVFIDKAGNVWVTDNGGKDEKGHQVIKFDQNGKILMRLGKPGIAGDGPDTFNQPDGVVIAANGDIFVADGHTAAKGNARVVKFSKDGKFIKQWGEHGSGPGQFEVPHGLAIDSKGRIFVADRNNKRVQIFDQDGKFLDAWKQFGEPSGVFIDSNDVLYVADSLLQSTDAKNEGSYNPGFEQGIRIGSAKDGKVMAFIPATNAPEGVGVDLMGNVYGSDTFLKDVRKYVKK